jgi:hypothetical protein
MKYNLTYFEQIIANNDLKTFAELRKLFPHLHTFYCRHKQKIGELPLVAIKRGNNALTKVECSVIAQKYTHRSDFQQQDKGAYLTAMRKKWLDDICSHMVPKPFIAKGGKPGQPAHNRVELAGQTFGKWTVLARAGVGKSRGWTCQCNCGTTAEISTSSLKLGLSTKCSKCSNQVSKPMLELAEYIKGLGIEVLVSHRDFGFEIDLYVPSKNFFIEYDGLVWHSSKFRATAANEAARFAKFKALGLQGMRIFEDQYLQKPELVKQMIRHRLGLGAAQQIAQFTCEIVQSPSTHREFCNKYHMDGYGRSSWAIVARNESNEVVAFMGFRPYMAGKYKGQQELSRFCTNYNFNCYGLFGKMLKMAKQHIRAHKLATHVVSASDNHISVGKVYANNGFKQLEADSLNWFYYLHSKGLRMHRAMGRKLKPPQITEAEYVQYGTEKLQTESGFLASKRWSKWEPLYKIFGWGQKLWVCGLN